LPARLSPRVSPRRVSWRRPMSSAESYAIPEDALDERFLAATGPGGQNVNKVATAVQIRLDVYALRLEPEVFARLKTLAGSRFTEDGAIVLTARRFRTQEANRIDARARLAELIERAHHRPVRRIKTRPSKAAKAKRLEGKSARSEIKRGRGKVSFD
jgi:ribosome-associated protein